MKRKDSQKKAIGPPSYRGARARAGGQTLQTCSIGALPIINQLLERMQLERFLKQHLPSDGRRMAVPTPDPSGHSHVAEILEHTRRRHATARHQVEQSVKTEVRSQRTDPPSAPDSQLELLERLCREYVASVKRYIEQQAGLLPPEPRPNELLMKAVELAANVPAHQVDQFRRVVLAAAQRYELAGKPFRVSSSKALYRAFVKIVEQQYTSAAITTPLPAGTSPPKQAAPEDISPDLIDDDLV